MRKYRAMADGPLAQGRCLAGLVLAVALAFAIGCQSGPEELEVSTVQSAQPAPSAPAATVSAPTPAATVANTAIPVSPTIPAATESPTAESEAPDLSRDGPAAELRELASRYWEAFNEYDTAQVLAMLEPVHRAAEEDAIRGDIGRMKMFRAKLTVSEVSPPVSTESGRWEMFMSMATPIDTRTIRMEFVEDNGRWYISFADEY